MNGERHVCNYYTQRILRIDDVSPPRSLLKNFKSSTLELTRQSCNRSKEKRGSELTPVGLEWGRCLIRIIVSKILNEPKVRNHQTIHQQDIFLSEFES